MSRSRTAPAEVWLAGFAGYLRQARAVLAALPRRIEDGPTGLSAEFEALRWFPLPAACLFARPGEVTVRTEAGLGHPRADPAAVRDQGP